MNRKSKWQEHINVYTNFLTPYNFSCYLLMLSKSNYLIALSYTTTLVRWKKRLEPKRNRNKPATKINMGALKEDVKNYPDSYVYERAKRLGASRNGVYYALKRLNITYKKNFKSSESKTRRETIFPE